MSKEKILGIIDTLFVLGNDCYYDNYDNSYHGPEIEYLLIRQKDGVVLFDDFYFISFDYISGEIVFHMLDESQLRYPIETFPEYIDDSFLSGKSKYFKNSSLLFAKGFIDYLIDNLRDNNREGIWTSYILRYSNFITKLLNFYIIRKCEHYLDCRSDQVTFQMLKDIEKLKSHTSPIVKILSNHSRIPLTNANWNMYSSTNETVNSTAQVHYLSDNMNESEFYISMENCKENPLFIFLTSIPSNPTHTEKSIVYENYIITYSGFEELIKSRKFSYNIIKTKNMTRRESTPDFYESELNNLAEMECFFSSLTKNPLHKLSKMDDKDLRELGVVIS